MGVLKEAFIMGICLAGIINSIYGVPFVGAYSISGNRGALYWTSLFLLGNFSSYLVILLLGLYQGEDVMALVGELRPIFCLLIILLSLLCGFIILLTALTTNRFLVSVMERIILSGSVVYLFGFLVGLYLGKSAIGMGIYLQGSSLPKPTHALASFLFALGSFISPLYLVAGLFRIFPRGIKTLGERRFWDFLASLLLLITGLCFLFRG